MPLEEERTGSASREESEETMHKLGGRGLKLDHLSASPGILPPPRLFEVPAHLIQEEPNQRFILFWWNLNLNEVGPSFLAFLIMLQLWKSALCDITIWWSPPAVVVHITRQKWKSFIPADSAYKHKTSVSET